ncbi:DUF6191 domain-containing protein [Isoptericola sp. NPDC055881]
MLSSLFLLLLIMASGVAVAATAGFVTSLRPRRTKPHPGHGGATGALGELIDVFQPSRTHTQEELEYKRLEIRQAPGTEPGVSLDLDAGRAVVRLDPPPPSSCSPRRR